MVLVRRKPVIYHDLPQELSNIQSNKDVYYIPQTGEIFIDYELRGVTPLKLLSQN